MRGLRVSRREPKDLAASAFCCASSGVQRLHAVLRRAGCSGVESRIANGVTVYVRAPYYSGCRELWNVAPAVPSQKLVSPTGLHSSALQLRLADPLLGRSARVDPSNSLGPTLLVGDRSRSASGRGIRQPLFSEGVLGIDKSAAKGSF